MLAALADNGSLFDAIRRVVAFVGDYGSGKTEVAVNFTLALAEREQGVRIADLDIVNPYFRSREALALMEERGIGVITPRGEQLGSELPIILPEVKGLLQDGAGRAVLDIGGEDLGARVLSSFHGALRLDETDMLLVLNANRPFTDSLPGVLAVIDRIEAAARVPVTGVVVNTHLMEHSSSDDVLRGHDLALEVQAARDIPLRFVAAMEELIEGLDAERFAAPLFPMTRIMVPPWLRRQKLGPALFKL